ncbi:MAG: DUF2283 domain-containing protein [Pseudomonadota bacterium]
MRITYDPEANAAYITLSEQQGGVVTHTISEDINIDVYANGALHGIELLNANEQLAPDGGDLLVQNLVTGQEVRLKLKAA